MVLQQRVESGAEYLSNRGQWAPSEPAGDDSDNDGEAGQPQCHGNPPQVPQDRVDHWLASPNFALRIRIPAASAYDAVCQS